MILAADVGGTKTHVALYESGAGPRRPALERRVRSRDYPSLDDLVRGFLAGAEAEPSRATFGIPGPVVGNAAVTTNLPWQVSGESLAQSLRGASVVLLNDLEATAWGLATLTSADLLPLQVGRPSPGNRALIAAGTGLGEALLVWDDQGWHPTPSEGGHSDFGPRDPVEDELLGWLRERYGRVSYERILSGPGLADLYRFQAATDRGRASQEVAEQFATAADPAVVVTEAALAGTCERSRMVLERFVSIYGAEAGNLALKALAVGGVYVGGGIAPRILRLLEAGDFMKAFVTKGRLTRLLEQMPVSIIMRPEAALWGAAAYALAHDREEPA